MCNFVNSQIREKKKKKQINFSHIVVEKDVPPRNSEDNDRGFYLYCSGAIDTNPLKRQENEYTSLLNVSYTRFPDLCKI